MPAAGGSGTAATGSRSSSSPPVRTGNLSWSSSSSTYGPHDAEREAGRHLFEHLKRKHLAKLTLFFFPTSSLFLPPPFPSPILSI